MSNLSATFMMEYRQLLSRHPDITPESIGKLIYDEYEKRRRNKTRARNMATASFSSIPSELITDIAQRLEISSNVGKLASLTQMTRATLTPSSVYTSAYSRYLQEVRALRQYVESGGGESQMYKLVEKHAPSNLVTLTIVDILNTARHHYSPNELVRYRISEKYPINSINGLNNTDMDVSRERIIGKLICLAMNMQLQDIIDMLAQVNSRETARHADVNFIRRGMDLQAADSWNNPDNMSELVARLLYEELKVEIKKDREAWYYNVVYLRNLTNVVRIVTDSQYVSDVMKNNIQRVAHTLSKMGATSSRR